MTTTSAVVIKPLASSVRKTTSTSPPQVRKEAAKRKKRNPSPYETKIDFSPEEKTVLEIKRTNKTQKLMWTPELHCIFLTALKQLGIDAVPKQLHLRMNVAGITRENVASHLQKFRQRLRKMKNPVSIPQYIQQELDKVSAILRRKQELAANAHSLSIAQRATNYPAGISTSPSSNDDEFDAMLQELYNSSSDDDSFNSSQIFDDLYTSSSSPEFEVAQQDVNYAQAQASYTLPPGVYPAQPAAQFAAYAVPKPPFYPPQFSVVSCEPQTWEQTFSTPTTTTTTYQHNNYYPNTSSSSTNPTAPYYNSTPYHGEQTPQVFFKL